MLLQVHLDYSEELVGTFQVISIEDENGNNLIEKFKIDVGTHYLDLNSLKEDILKNSDLEEVILEEV